MRSAISEGIANTAARPFRFFGLAVFVGLMLGLMSTYYGSLGSDIERAAAQAVESGEFTWSAIYPGGKLSASECLRLADQEWVTSVVGLRAQAPIKLATSGDSVERFLFVGDPSVLSPRAKPNLDTGVLVGELVSAAVPGGIIEPAVGSDMPSRVSYGDVITSTRFPEYSNAILVSSPTDQIDVCIIDTVTSVDLDFISLISGQFSAPQIAASPAQDEIVRSIVDTVDQVESRLVRDISILASVFAIGMPGVLDRRERGLLHMVGWNRAQLSVMFAVENLIATVSFTSVALAVVLVSSQLSGFTPLGIRVGSYNLIYAMSCVVIFSLMLSMYWVSRSPRSLLLSQ